jgi:hypothetical protein
LRFSLAILCFLGVLAFHFPQYLTTPELRRSYDVNLMRQLLFWSLVLAGALSLVNLVFRRAPWLAGAAFALVLVSALLGGHQVEVDPNFPDHTPYIGLDWFILDLLGSALIFIFIEKLFALRKDQPVFRPEWQTDFQHFIVNHMGRRRGRPVLRRHRRPARAARAAAAGPQRQGGRERSASPAAAAPTSPTATSTRASAAQALHQRQPGLLPLGPVALHAGRLHRPGAEGTASASTKSTRASCSATARPKT